MTAAAKPATPTMEAVRALFRGRFGREATVVASAPGRVNLIGEHTDYNGGEVLPMAIARRTFVAAGWREDGSGRLRAVSATQKAEGEAELTHPEKSGRWWDYLLGVAAPLMKEARSPSHRGEGGVTLHGLDVAVMSDVPTGSGLSSSAALEVATALAVSSLLQEPLPLREAAMVAWRAETGFVGVASGIMDQFASALGREGEVLHIECDTARYDHAPFTEAVLIFDTAIPRSLRTSLYNERRAECDEALRLLRERWPELPSLAAAEPEQVLEATLPDPLDRRALHVSRETRRVREAVSLLRAGKPLTRELLVGSHESLRDLYECSRAELDWFVERALRERGVRGARLTGAGWGGCAIAIGDEEAMLAAAPGIAREYEARFRLTPRSWMTRAGAGARVEATN